MLDSGVKAERRRSRRQVWTSGSGSSTPCGVSLFWASSWRISNGSVPRSLGRPIEECRPCLRAGLRFSRRLSGRGEVHKRPGLAARSGPRDVLLFYDLLGLPFLLFMRRRPKTLVVWSVVALAPLLLIALALTVTAFGDPARGAGREAIDAGALGRSLRAGGAGVCL